MKYRLLFIAMFYNVVMCLAQVDFLKSNIDTADVPANVLLSDLDQDGDVDIIGSDLNNGQVIWYQNNGSEDFSREVLLEETDNGEVSIGDLDGDGDLDIVTEVPPQFFGPGSLAWFKNNGAQEFEKIELEIACALSEPQIVDIDLDGDNDIVGVTHCGNFYKFVLWRNDDLTFVYEELYETDG